MSEDVEEVKRHMDLIQECCQDIKMACNKDVTKVFQRAGESLSDNLDKIRRHEKRINT